ncbi:MAG: 30S ribosomal protein S2 [Candidatus Roizmanbacteria bacterium]
MKKTTPEELLTAGSHLGHKKQKVHPKAYRYIYKIENGVSIIDLFKTAEKLQEAKEFVFKLGSENKVLLFVATKKNARDIVGEICGNLGLMHITNKWTAGFITNFSEISKNIKELRKLKSEKEEGVWKKFVKHEQTALEKKSNKIASIYHGVELLEKLPDAVFVVDAKKEHNALIEADRMDIATVAIVDTNCDPHVTKYPIPANDDSISSVKLITEEIAMAYKEGLKTAVDPKTQDTTVKTEAKESPTKESAKPKEKAVEPKKKAVKKAVKEPAKKASKKKG